MPFDTVWLAVAREQLYATRDPYGELGHFLLGLGIQRQLGSANGSRAVLAGSLDLTSRGLDSEGPPSLGGSRFAPALGARRIPQLARGASRSARHRARRRKRGCVSRPRGGDLDLGSVASTARVRKGESPSARRARLGASELCALPRRPT